MSAGQIVQVDPAALTIALNVRTDAKVDREFVASIKELGVLQPPMVVANDAGGYDVVLGQRRVLAAVQAGLKTIPAYLVEKSEADAARVVDQLTENEQRQHLTPSEVVGGYKQLALFGLSPAQIAKKVARPRMSIDTALAVADDERASLALDEGMPLDQAAVLVEFAGDKAAVKRLSGAGETFSHVAAELREKRAFNAEVARLLAELATEKVAVIARVRQTYENAKLEGHNLAPIGQYGKPGSPSERLEPKDVKKKGALAADVARDWTEVDGAHRYWPVKRYWLVDPAESGFERLVRESAPARELTPEEQAADVEREARWAREREEREAYATATGVRWAWLREFLQRKTLPADVMAFVARVAVATSLGADQRTFDWLGEPLSEEQIEGADAGDVEVLLTDLAARVGALKFMVAVAVDSCESLLRYVSRAETAAWYLPLLVAWGYGLSEAEQGLLVVEVESE